jgi:hypothetical protein
VSIAVPPLIACPVDYSENLRLTDILGHLDETL